MEGRAASWMVSVFFDGADHMTLGEAWRDFAEARVVRPGYLLVFEYLGDGVLVGKMFDSNLCRKEVDTNSSHSDGSLASGLVTVRILTSRFLSFFSGGLLVFYASCVSTSFVHVIKFRSIFRSPPATSKISDKCSMHSPHFFNMQLSGKHDSNFVRKYGLRFSGIGPNRPQPLGHGGTKIQDSKDQGKKAEIRLRKPNGEYRKGDFLYSQRFCGGEIP